MAAEGVHGGEAAVGGGGEGEKVLAGELSELCWGNGNLEW